MHCQLHIRATSSPVDPGPRASLPLFTPFDRLSCLLTAVARVKRCILFAARPQVVREGCVRVLTVSCVRDTGTEHEKLLGLTPTNTSHQVFAQTVWDKFFLNTKVSAGHYIYWFSVITIMIV
jgi:hypothetical protein